MAFSRLAVLGLLLFLTFSIAGCGGGNLRPARSCVLVKEVRGSRIDRVSADSHACNGSIAIRVAVERPPSGGTA